MSEGSRPKGVSPVIRFFLPCVTAHTGAKRTRRGAQQPATHNAQNAHEEARSLSQTQTLSLCEDACQPENCQLAERVSD